MCGMCGSSVQRLLRVAEKLVHDVRDTLERIWIVEQRLDDDPQSCDEDLASPLKST